MQSVVEQTASKGNPEGVEHLLLKFKISIEILNFYPK